MIVTVVDTARIQGYVFGSNRLAENVGASELVHCATSAWVCDALDALGLRTNRGFGRGSTDGPRIERDALDAELIYQGGGNAVLLFRDRVDAERFARQLSERALTEAPGLELDVAHSPAFIWESQAFATALDQAFAALERAKAVPAPSSPLLGLGVTAACQSTGLPAIGLAAPMEGEPSPRLASAETLAKLDAAGAAMDRLNGFFALSPEYRYPSRFDDLGRSRGKHSYIAVVHADGDEMGARVRGLVNRFRAPAQNRALVAALRGFSHQVGAAAAAALKQTLSDLVGRIAGDGGGRTITEDLGGGCEAALDLGWSPDERAWWLPVRPLVFGGDDITLVCDGRLGLAVAVRYLERFTAVARFDDGAPASACAGVAMVKAHYPFARAYGLAAALCREAKDYRRELAASGGEFTGPCLDWHVAQSGALDEIASMREREYRTSAGHLTVRPVTLRPRHSDGHRSWQAVETAVRAFRGPDWAGRRNKAKALRSALRAGPEAVREFLLRYGLPRLPALGGDPDASGAGAFATTGWSNAQCGYFDALELADWYIGLDGGEPDAPAPAGHAAQ